MSSSPIHPELLAEIERYRAKHSLSRSAFGLRIMGDPRFIGDLESGREMRRATIKNLRDRMAEYDSQSAEGAA